MSELVRPDLRSKFWCMHLDEGFDRQEAGAVGSMLERTNFKDVWKASNLVAGKNFF